MADLRSPAGDVHVCRQLLEVMDGRQRSTVERAGYEMGKRLPIYNATGARAVIGSGRTHFRLTKAPSLSERWPKSGTSCFGSSENGVGYRSKRTLRAARAEVGSERLMIPALSIDERSRADVSRAYRLDPCR